VAASASSAFTAAESATLAAVIWFGRVDWLAVSVSIAAWHFAGSGVLAEEVAVDDAVTLGVVEDAADDAVEAAEEAAVLPLAAAVTVTVTVAVWVTVAVSVTVFVTVATGLAVVVGMSGMHWEMKIGSAVSTVCTPV